MGFGTLIFGYFLAFAFSVSTIYFFADILGALVMIYAFSKLAEYNRWFNTAMIADLVFLGFCAVNASNLLIGWYAADGTLAYLIGLFKELAACVLHVFVFLGTKGIAQGAGADELAKKTDARFVMTMLWYGMNLLALAFGTLLGSFAGYVSVALLLYRFACLFLNLALFYHCFGMIMPAEGDGEKKRSKIPLFRYLDEKFDELDEKRNAYRKESMQMAWDEAGRRAAEKEKKKKKKKK